MQICSAQFDADVEVSQDADVFDVEQGKLLLNVEVGKEAVAVEAVVEQLGVQYFWVLDANVVRQDESDDRRETDEIK